MAEVLDGFDWVAEEVEGVGIGLMLPLAKLRFLPLLLLVKDVDGVL
jgi:hypothetical protein